MIRHRALSFVVVAVLGSWSDTAWSAPIVIPVRCGGGPVGAIVVDAMAFPAGLRGIEAQFHSTVGRPGNMLVSAARQCREDHFNWYQVVVSDNQPGVDASGTRLKAPYIDLPPGGFGNAPETEVDDTVWADKLPWHLNETSPPKGTKGFKEQLQLSASTFGDFLLLQDAPDGPMGTSLVFQTWLVSLNADRSFHSWHGGFEWRWNKPFLVPDVTITRLLFDPTKARYDDLLGGFDQKLVVPEPGTASLVLLGLLALAGRVRSRG